MKKTSENKSILKKEFTIPFFNIKNFKKIFGELKNRKKSRIYKRKRKTFRGLLIKNTLMGLFLTVIFAVGFYVVGTEYIYSQTELNLSNLLAYNQRAISGAIGQENLNDITARMRINNYANIVFGDSGKYQMAAGLTDEFETLALIRDKDGNIKYSSRKGVQAFLQLSKDEKMFVLCDTENADIPELKQLEQYYMELTKKEEHYTGNFIIENYSISPEITIKSAYVNKEEQLFIPHEAEVYLEKYYLEKAYPEEILETKSFTINLPENYSDYELIDFNTPEIEYPRMSFLCGFYGTDKEVFDELEKHIPAHKDILFSSHYISKNCRLYYRNTEVYIDNEPYVLSVGIMINPWNEVTKPLYFKWVIIFLIAMIVIAFLDAWRRNVKNQADYNFEDYQKNLTDSLAHDLKTPLMAINGYVENIMTGNLNEKETNKYLSAVMDNISYTDSIITRTLDLNAINSVSMKPVKFDLCRLINNSVEKYSLLLDEKNISVITDGTGEVTADSATLKIIIENLISNAVAYTAENGKINISISDKNLIIKNTVGKKVDVKELKKPFKKGDKARSNNTGIGLGLTIADNASAINGFKLDISCSDTEFKAEVKF